MINKNIPNLFIVGAAKCATTSVHDILKSHTEILMSSIKEPNYFADFSLKDLSKYKQQFYTKTNNKLRKGNFIGEQHATLIEEEELYLKLFKTEETFQYFGESSVSYLFSNHSAERIHKFNSKSKIIIILRNPIERMISHFQMDLLIGELNGVNKNLEKIVEQEFKNIDDVKKNSLNKYLGQSLYFDQVKRFYDYFSPENILLLNYEADLSAKNDLLIEKLSAFLKLDKNHFSITKSTKNAKKTPKNVIVSNFTKNSSYKQFFKQILSKNFKEFLKSRILYSDKTKNKEFTFSDEVIDLFINEKNDLTSISETISVNWNFDKFRKNKRH